MRSITVDEQTGAAVLLVGGRAGQARRATGLLAEGGFGVAGVHHVQDLLGDAAPLDASAIVLLLDDEPPAVRIRTIATLTKAHSDARVATLMPAGASIATLQRTLAAGARGIVLEDELAWTLAVTLRAVAAGQLVVPGVLARQITPRPLSYREKQILGLVARGATNREIADRLFLAESTVKTHLSSVFAKLDTRSRSEAAARVLDPANRDGAAILAIADSAPAQVR